MKINTHYFVAAVMLAIASGLFLQPLRAHAQAEFAVAPANPLAMFERLIGGQWHLDQSYQQFEWGVGQLSVKAQNYFIVDGKPTLVSEGFWFWHPGKKQIKGIFTATEMPVVLFDYTTRFEPKKMVNELLTYGAKGDQQAYLETWEFTDDTHYQWKLWQRTPAGMREEMAGTYTRAESGPDK